MTSKLISLVLVLALAAMPVAIPGTVGAQDECPVAVNATTPLGVFIAQLFLISEILLDKFVTKEWNAENQTCNVTGLTSAGASLVGYLGDITMSAMAIVADIVKMLAGT